MVAVILTCNLNGNRIDCIGGKYTRDQLKQWGSKNILRCPVCDGVYEYCHGRVVTPYFRHHDKKMCTEIYSEPETEEHKKGKIGLYEWVLKQENITDVILEGWVEGTRQRPDLMFKYMGKQYVIEFQCSPICSEFYARHELYKAGGIVDIWITGTERYNLQSSARRGFTIEQFASASFDVVLNKINFTSSHIQKMFPEVGYYSRLLSKTYSLEQCNFNSGLITVISNHIKDDLPILISKFKQEEAGHDAWIKTIETIFSTLEEIKNKYGFTITNRSSPNYIAKIEFQSGHVAFIKENKIDYCTVEFGNMPQHGFSYKKNRSIITGYRDRFYHRNIRSEKFEQITCDSLVSSIDTFCSEIGGGV